MAAVAALLDSRAAHHALRRALAAGPSRAVACRSPAGVLRACRERHLDAIVLGLRPLRQGDLDQLGARYPAIPVVLYAAVRPDHAGLVADLLDNRLAGVVVEGVDEAVAGDLVRRHGLGRAREAALADAPRLLRLTEPIQLEAWRRVLRRAGEALSVRELAAGMRVSREHLSRQFAAGGAPNLKRVIDLLRVVCAAQILANPGCDARVAARILRFSSASHLAATARRICGAPTARLAGLGPRGVLAGFVRDGTRSRAR